MSNKVIDIYNSLNLVSDYNRNGFGTQDKITIDSSGFMTIWNTTPSTSPNTGALVLNSGGLSINCGINAVSSTQGGALTVAGGIGVAGDLYVGGTIYYSNAAQASSEFAYLTLTATDGAVSFTSGALLTYGGIVIQSEINATSITSGGGLLIAGGAAVGQDFYVGGTIYPTNISTASLTSFNSSLTNATISNAFITTSTVSNLVVNKLNATVSTVGSIYTTGGNVGINNTAPSYSLDINGAFRATGTSGTLNAIATNTLTDVLQIQNTNASGASSIRFVNNTGTGYLYTGFGNVNSTTFQNTAYTQTASGVAYKIVAGNQTSNPVIFNAMDNSVSITTTTPSNDTSSGSLKLSGGLAVQGNLNVGGQLNINSPFTVNVNSTQTSSNSTTGALKLIGGLSINLTNTANANASSYTAGGSITVSGGIAIAQDTYIGGILDVQSGSNNMNPIKLQSLQISSNYNNGAATVIQSGNASRTAVSFTPIQFAGWNDQSNPKMTINTNTIDLINNLNAINNANTLGNLYTTGGNVGINTTSPSANLDVISTSNSFGNVFLGQSLQNRKLVLYSLATNNHQYQGLGSNTSVLRYQTEQITSDHVFYSAVSSTSSNELFRIKGTGNVNMNGTMNSTTISTGSLFVTNDLVSNSSINSLNVSGVTAANINFTGNLYQNGSLYIASQWSGTTGNTLYYGSSGNVFVGIGTTNPSYTLDVNGNVRISSSQDAINSTVGSLVMMGGFSVASTTDASSFTQGGSLTVAGGASIAKTLCVGNYLNMGGASSFFGGSFTAGNNVTTPSNVTGLLFPTATIRSFTTNIAVSIALTSGTNLYAQYTIDGLQTASGWYIDDSFIGDNTGISFSINSTTGQLLYTTSNQTNWLSTTLRFYGTMISITGNYLPGVLSSTGNFNVSGILSVYSTTDSTNTSVGALQVTGGAGITKSVTVGGNLILNNVSYIFSGVSTLNNGTTVNGTTGISFPSSGYRSFSMLVDVSVTATSSLYSQYTVEGIQRASGWSIYTTTLGDTIDITFSINNSGQILYSSSTTYAGWVSTNLNYQVTALAISNGNSPVTLPTSGNQIITGNLAITSTANASATSTGALAVSGGMSCVSDLIVGGNIYGNSPTTIIQETQNNGVNANIYSSGSFVNRTLNTIVLDTIGVTLNSNQFTLPAGRFLILANCPAYGCNGSKAVLYNVTNASNLILGTSTFAGTSQTYSIISGAFTISVASTFAIQQYFSASTSSMGGIAVSAGVTEVYTQINIVRVL